MIDWQAKLHKAIVFQATWMFSIGVRFSLP